MTPANPPTSSPTPLATSRPRSSTPAPFQHLRWLQPHPLLDTPELLLMPGDVNMGTEKLDHPIILFPNDWTMDYFIDKKPDIVLHDQPIEQID